MKQKQKYLSDFLSLLGQIVALEQDSSESLLVDVKRILDSVSHVSKKQVVDSESQVIVSNVIQQSNGQVKRQSGQQKSEKKTNTNSAAITDSNVSHSLTVLNPNPNSLSNSFSRLPKVIDANLRNFCSTRSQIEIGKHFRVSQPIVSIWARQNGISTVQKKR